MSNGATTVTQEYCRYSMTKIDSEVLSRARAAAELDGKTLQDWISDVINEASADVVKRDPIKRKSNPPHPKKRPKPKK